jgi:hydroxypyruvate isomerase
MPNFDLCIEPLFPGMNSSQKVKKVAELGWNAIEFWFWDHEFDGANLLPAPKNVDEIAAITSDLNIIVNNVVVNAPDGSIGGSLTNMGDKRKYLQRLQETIGVARKLRCTKMITCTGNILEGVPLKSQRDSILQILAKAARIAENEGIMLLLEALNSTVDHPGYYLTSTKEGFEIVREIGSPSLKLLYDIYHMQVMEGNLINTIQQNIDLIGHFHCASLPGRNEIYRGEIDYKAIFTAIGQTSYSGYLGLEYWPTDPSENSLSNTLTFLGLR